MFIMGYEVTDSRTVHHIVRSKHYYIAHSVHIYIYQHNVNKTALFSSCYCDQNNATWFYLPKKPDQIKLRIQRSN